jgi:hypothetical protein
VFSYYRDTAYRHAIVGLKRGFVARKVEHRISEVHTGVKRGLPYGKSDLIHRQKRPTVRWHTWSPHKCQKRPMCTANETYLYGKRGLQKRPTHRLTLAYIYIYMYIYIYIYIYIHIYKCWRSTHNDISALRASVKRDLVSPSKRDLFLSHKRLGFRG